MLVEHEPGDFKVLLTNTVYPVRHASDRLRYRVKGKSSPDLVLRAISAWPVSSLASAVSGGECVGQGQDEVFFARWPDHDQPDSAPQGLQVRNVWRAIQAASSGVDQEIFLLKGVGVSFDDCLHVLRSVIGPGWQENLSLEDSQGCRTWGLHTSRKGEGIATYSESDKELARYLNRVVASWGGGQPWTALSVYRNEAPNQLLAEVEVKISELGL